MENQKIILRAIAGTVKHYPKEALAVAMRYDSNLNKDANVGQLVNSIVAIFFSENESFVKEFNDLMYRTGQIKEYNNVVGATAVISAIGSAIGGVTNMIGSIVGSRNEVIGKQYEYGSEVQETSQEILRMIQSENAVEMQGGKSQTTIVITIIVIATALTGIVIYKKL